MLLCKSFKHRIGYLVNTTFFKFFKKKGQNVVKECQNEKNQILFQLISYKDLFFY